jgi:hypothetical protein
VHPTNRPLAAIEPDIGLGDDGLETVRSELVLAERAGEESAGVLPPLEIDDESPFELGFRKDHGAPESDWWKRISDGLSKPPAIQLVPNKRSPQKCCRNDEVH